MTVCQFYSVYSAMKERNMKIITELFYFPKPLSILQILNLCDVFCSRMVAAVPFIGYDPCALIKTLSAIMRWGNLLIKYDLL